MPKETASVVEPVEVGETWSVWVRDAEIVHTVAEPCEEKTRGYWVCLTHGESFPNNLQMDGHIGRGSHRLGWYCFEHGLEKP